MEWSEDVEMNNFILLVAMNYYKTKDENVCCNDLKKKSFFKCIDKNILQENQKNERRI